MKKLMIAAALGAAAGIPATIPFSAATAASPEAKETPRERPKGTPRVTRERSPQASQDFCRLGENGFQYAVLCFFKDGNELNQRLSTISIAANTAPSPKGLG